MELVDGGLLLAVDGKPHYFSSQILDRFAVSEPDLGLSVVPSAVSALPSQPILASDRPDGPSQTLARHAGSLDLQGPLQDSTLIPPAIVPPTSAPPELTEDNRKPSTKAPASLPLGAALLFSGPVVIPVPAPEFNQDGLDRDSSSKLIRWKNVYDYAVKEREMSRLRAPMTEAFALAKILRDPEMFRLAGVFAINFGDRTLAREALE
ncbi:MAG: hypothetical protein ABL994_24070, partial [Verrucomicrobiales bacterium]